MRLSSAARALPVVAIVLVAALLSGYYALQATNWVVMTDELQISKLATSIAETFSPAPTIHGERYGPPSQLYPLVIAPFFGALDVPDAIDVAHALNALLLASAAWPAYLLARDVTRSAAGGYFAAALTAFVPWLVLASTLLTENVAYPAFVWCVFLAYRTITAPSAGRDAAALAGLFVAFLARTQLILLAFVVPAALVAHELAYAASTAPPGRRLAELRPAARRAVSQHRLLLAGYAVAGLAAAAAAAAGGLRGVFGTYEGAFEGDLLPSGVWRAAAAHLDYVVVAVGIAPFLLATAWAVATLIRPARREAHAFAVLLLVLAPILTVQVASFNQRFTPGGFIQDRYLFYLAPLLAVGSAAALLERSSRALRASLVLVCGGVLAWLVGLAPFPSGAVIFWASPASAFHGALVTAAGWIDLSAATLVRYGGLVIAATLAMVVWRATGVAALAVTGTLLAALGVAELLYVADRAALPVTTRAQLLSDVQRDWVDALVPSGTSVALVPNPVLGPELWWEVEFWNKTVDRAVGLNGTTYTPFPAEEASVDFDTGSVRGLRPGELFVLAAGETRLRFAGASTIFTAPPLTLVRVARPHRAEWATKGAYADGWTRPERPLNLRFFPIAGSGLSDVTVTVSAPDVAARRLPFALRSGETVRPGLVTRGRARRVRLPVCVPSSGFGRATLATPVAIRLPDGRSVGLHVDAIEARPTGRPCEQPGAAR